ncbi:MAG: outer membrane beta-barrel protein [Bacteroidetes bacterium]|nr:outer membrane beta-barrel protein [Bacteroidota bacterium]
MSAKEHFDNDLRNVMMDHAIEPDPVIWVNVNHELRKRKTRFPLWLKVIFISFSAAAVETITLSAQLAHEISQDKNLFADSAIIVSNDQEELLFEDQVEIQTSIINNENIHFSDHEINRTGYTENLGNTLSSKDATTKKQEGNIQFIPDALSKKINGLDITNNLITLNPISAITFENLQFEFDNIRNHYNSIHHSSGNSHNSSGIYIGSLVSFNSIAIINQNTYGEFNGKELAYKPSYGFAYGMSLNKTISPKLGLELDWLLNSQQGQSYEDEFSFGEYKRSVKLRYTQIPVILKIRSNRCSRQKYPIADFHILLGLQLGALKSAEIITNGVSSIASEKFNKIDFSSLAGVEYQLFISRQTYISLSARGTVSVIDINAKGWKVEDAYGRSQNLSVGMNLGINYLLK